MDLKNYLSEQPSGGFSKLAKLINAHVPDLSRWASGKRKVPVHKAMAIERATNGIVTRADLRPDDYFLIWPDLKAPTSAQKGAAID